MNARLRCGSTGAGYRKPPAASNWALNLLGFHRSARGRANRRVDFQEGLCRRGRWGCSPILKPAEPRGWRAALKSRRSLRIGSQKGTDMRESTLQCYRCRSRVTLHGETVECRECGYSATLKATKVWIAFLVAKQGRVLLRDSIKAQPDGVLVFKTVERRSKRSTRSKSA